MGLGGYLLMISNNYSQKERITNFTNFETKTIFLNILSEYVFDKMPNFNKYQILRDKNKEVKNEKVKNL